MMNEVRIPEGKRCCDDKMNNWCIFIDVRGCCRSYCNLFEKIKYNMGDEYIPVKLPECIKKYPKGAVFILKEEKDG